MKMRIFILLILFMVARVSSAAENVILVDNSGSMAGFYDTGSIQSLVCILQQIIGKSGIYLFNQNGPEAISDNDGLACSTYNTRIDAAFQGILSIQSMRPDIVWLITDNIQDRAEKPGIVDADTQEYYKILQSNDVYKIFVIPCFLRFNGKVYLGTEYEPYKIEEHNGERGLLVYGILLNNAYGKQFGELATKLEEKMKIYRSKFILAKPLDNNTLDMIIADQIPGDRPANVHLINERTFAGKGFKEGKEIQVIFYVKLLSKFEDLIVSGKLNTGIVDNHFKSQDFNNSNIKCSVYPERVDNIGPGETSQVIYKIKINVTKVKMKKNILSILRAVEGKPGMVEGIIRLQVQVQDDDFRLTNRILNDYNTDDISNYKKIYGMKSLISSMSAPTTNIPIDYNMALAVEYPKWPLILIILLAVVVFGLGYLIYKAFTSGENFSVSINGGKEEIIPLSPFFGRYNVCGTGGVFASIYKSIFGIIYTKPKHGFLIDGTEKKKQLNKDMDYFTVSDSNGVNSANVTFQSVTKNGASGTGGKSGLDEGFDNT